MLFIHSATIVTILGGPHEESIKIKSNLDYFNNLRRVNNIKGHLLKEFDNVETPHDTGTKQLARPIRKKLQVARKSTTQRSIKRSAFFYCNVIVQMSAWLRVVIS